MEKNCCKYSKTTLRTKEESVKMIHRLNRIEGQVKGIKKMVESGAYCTDVLVQVCAVSKALNAFSKQLLSTHIKNCVVTDIKNGNEQTVEELVDVVKKFIN